MNNRINIDDELSNLWKQIYCNLILFVKENNSIGFNIKLDNCVVKSIFVDEEGLLWYTDHNDKTDYAENYNDYVHYEVYNAVLANRVVFNQ